jgi:type II secretion system protein H
VTSSRHTLRPRASHRTRAFTLIEVLVVLSLLALIAGLAAPRLQRGLDGVALESAIHALAHACRAAQRQARATATPVTVSIELPAGRSNADQVSDPWSWPAGTALEVTGIAARADHVPVVFYPDGSSSGLGLSARLDGHHRTLTVAWFTGAVTLGP